MHFSWLWRGWLKTPGAYALETLRKRRQLTEAKMFRMFPYRCFCFNFFEGFERYENALYVIWQWFLTDDVIFWGKLYWIAFISEPVSGTLILFPENSAWSSVTFCEKNFWKLFCDHWYLKTHFELWFLSSWLRIEGSWNH